MSADLRQVVVLVPPHAGGRFDVGDVVTDDQVDKFLLPTRYVHADGSPLGPDESHPMPKFRPVVDEDGRFIGVEEAATAGLAVNGRTAPTYAGTMDGEQVDEADGRRTAVVTASLDGCAVRVEMTCPVGFDGVNVYSVEFRGRARRALNLARQLAEGTRSV